MGVGAGGRSSRSDRSSGWHSKSEEQSKTVTTGRLGSKQWINSQSHRLLLNKLLCYLRYHLLSPSSKVVHIPRCSFVEESAEQGHSGWVVRDTN